MHLMLLLIEEDLIIVFSICLNEYFVPTNPVLSSSLMINLSLNPNFSSWETALFVDVAFCDTVEVLAELQWLLRLIGQSPDSTL